MNASLTLTMTLVVALLVHVALKFWLNARQVRHVAGHRPAVPLDYAETVSLADHQKAADYTLAKARLSQLDIALDAAVLLGWTLLGGLDALNQLLLEWMGSGMLQQVALVLGFTLVGGLISLPLSLMQTFGVEQRSGLGAGHAIVVGRAVAHAGWGRQLVAMGLVGACGLAIVFDGDCPQRDHAAVQQVHALGRRVAQDPGANIDATCRFYR